MESEDVYCNCFWKKSKTTHAWQIFQGKVNIWNEMWTCEWKVSDIIVKDVNKTVWMKGYRQNGLVVRYRWECVKTVADYTHSAYIHNKHKKKWNFLVLTFWRYFLLKKWDFLGIIKNVLREFYYICSFGVILQYIRDFFWPFLSRLLINLNAKKEERFQKTVHRKYSISSLWRQRPRWHCEEEHLIVFSQRW
jgi:hypothetical protein